MENKIDEHFDGCYALLFWACIVFGIIKTPYFFIPAGIILISVLIKCYRKK